LDFYSACSLKKQSAGRHVTSQWHIILIRSQPVFALTQCCMLKTTSSKIKILVLGLTWPGSEPPIYSSRGEHANHYTTDVVFLLLVEQMARSKWTSITQTNLFQNNTAHCNTCKTNNKEKNKQTFLVAELLLYIIFITPISIWSGRIVSHYSWHILDPVISLNDLMYFFDLEVLI
jgi:hypothetical protein